MPRTCLLTLLLTLLVPAPHGELLERIRALDRKISRAPTAALHLQRAELHREHRDAERALADYERALELDPGLAAVHLARGRLRLATGALAAAEVDARRFVAARPDHGEGMALLAAVLTARGDRDGAERAWAGATPRLDPLRPHHVLARARNLERLAPDGPRRALAVLDRGRTRLGGAVVLELEALRIAGALGPVDDVVRRLDRLAAASPRGDRWLAEKGRRLEAAGRDDDAREAFRAVLAAIDALPRRVALLPATRRRRAAAHHALDRLSETDRDP